MNAETNESKSVESDNLLFMGKTYLLTVLKLDKQIYTNTRFSHLFAGFRVQGYKMDVFV
jgi:hypothetical protein